MRLINLTTLMYTLYNNQERLQAMYYKKYND